MKTDIFVIPKENEALDIDIKSNKAKYMEHILTTFFNLVCEDDLPEKVSLFKFRNTNLEVVVKHESYITNLTNLQDYYIKLEEFEKCNIIKDIIKKIELMNNKDGEVEQD